jgi:hypothetical protein
MHSLSPLLTHTLSSHLHSLVTLSSHFHLPLHTLSLLYNNSLYTGSNHCNLRDNTTIHGESFTLQIPNALTLSSPHTLPLLSPLLSLSPHTFTPFLSLLGGWRLPSTELHNPPLTNSTLLWRNIRGLNGPKVCVKM